MKLKPRLDWSPLARIIGVYSNFPTSIPDLSFIWESPRVIVSLVNQFQNFDWSLPMINWTTDV